MQGDKLSIWGQIGDVRSERAWLVLQLFNIGNRFLHLISIISHVGLFLRWYRFRNAWQYQPAALKAAGSFSNQFRPSALRYSLFNIPQIVLLCLTTLAKIRQYIFTILPLPVNLACTQALNDMTNYNSSLISLTIPDLNKFRWTTGRPFGTTGRPFVNQLSA